MWCSVVQCGVVQCGVVQCGAVWCSVVWCDVVSCALCNLLYLTEDGIETPRHPISSHPIPSHSISTLQLTIPSHPIPHAIPPPYPIRSKGCCSRSEHAVRGFPQSPRGGGQRTPQQRVWCHFYFGLRGI